MKAFILSCASANEGGGIYEFAVVENKLKRKRYFPCEMPMYAIMRDGVLHVILRGKKGESGSYFTVDGKLENKSEEIPTCGVVPCHLEFDGNFYCVNYLSGNVCKNGKTVTTRHGSSVNEKRQSESHTHFVQKTADGFLAVCDLGDDALVFFDENLEELSVAKVPSGYGIRHFVFSADGKYIYAVCELVPAVCVFEHLGGAAKLVATHDIPHENERANGAAIRISEDGKQLYVSLREENVIVTFMVKGTCLTEIARTSSFGDSPRDFDLKNGIAVVTNENTDNVVLFGLADGTLGEKLDEVSLPSPLCVVFAE